MVQHQLIIIETHFSLYSGFVTAAGLLAITTELEILFLTHGS